MDENASSANRSVAAKCFRMAKAGRGSHSGEERESDAFSVDVEQSVATLEERGKYAAASPLVGRQR